ncbi:MAG: hypothetical protein ACTSUC_15600 [Promethearchaeota archaeon]
MVNESGVMSSRLGLNLCYNRKAQKLGQNYAFNFGYIDKIGKYPNQSSDMPKLSEVQFGGFRKEV